jgi:hypothetical protein
MVAQCLRSACPFPLYLSAVHLKHAHSCTMRLLHAKAAAVAHLHCTAAQDAEGKDHDWLMVRA